MYKITRVNELVQSTSALYELSMIGRVNFISVSARATVLNQCIKEAQFFITETRFIECICAVGQVCALLHTFLSWRVPVSTRSTVKCHRVPIC